MWGGVGHGFCTCFFFLGKEALAFFSSATRHLLFFPRQQGTCFLSPPVHIARWAHMRHFASVCLSVCPSVCLSVCLDFTYFFFLGKEALAIFFLGNKALAFFSLATRHLLFFFFRSAPFPFFFSIMPDPPPPHDD